MRQPRSALSKTLLLSAALAVATAQAQAFEIFGFKFFEPKDEETSIVDPTRYEVELTVEGGDADLEQRLNDASLLIAEEDRAVSGSLGVLTKARNDFRLLVAVLYEEARYDGLVDITIEGQSIDTLPPDATFDTSKPVPVKITVQGGQVFTLGQVRLAGDAANLDPAEYELEPGGPAGSQLILRASEKMVEALKQEGRPLAAVTQRDVVADSATAKLDVTLTVAAGPVAGYGATTVEGTQAVDREFTRYMTGLEEGVTYDPDEVKEAEKRLAGLEVFDSVRVVTADELDEAGRIPVNVNVSERKFRYYGAGATFSTTEGVGIEGYWGHRNLFGRAEKLRIQGSISRIAASESFQELNYNAAILFEKPGVIGPTSKFIADLKSEFVHPDAYDKLSFGGGVGVAYELTPTQTVSAQFRAEWAKVEDFSGENKYLIVSTPLEYVFDNRTNPVDPKDGFRLLAGLEPSYDINGGSAFVKVRGEAAGYLALDSDKRFVLAARTEIGGIFGASDLTSVPADRRFYAGGGGSVRGYAYQGIGPYAPFRDDLEPTGGLSYAEASLELRFQVTDSIGIVPFLDAGTVSVEPFPDFSDVKIGAGLGVRYITPFGPIRLDVGVPLNPGPQDPSFGIYAGIGQSF